MSKVFRRTVRKGSVRLLKDMALPRPLFMTVACQRTNGRLLAGRRHYSESPCIHHLMTGAYLYAPTSKVVLSEGPLAPSR
jgi:hypothetical protein